MICENFCPSEQNLKTLLVCAQNCKTINTQAMTFADLPSAFLISTFSIPIILQDFGLNGNILHSFSLDGWPQLNIIVIVFWQFGSKDRMGDNGSGGQQIQFTKS